MKKIIIIAAAAVIFLGGMGGAFYMLWSKISSMEQVAAPETPVEEVEVEEEIDETPKPFYHLSTLIVNLADKDGRRYLRATMDMELENAEVEPKVEARLPQIKDAAIKILSTRQFNDISTVVGKNALRDEIMIAFNQIIKDELITNIYFTEFVVQ